MKSFKTILTEQNIKLTKLEKFLVKYECYSSKFYYIDDILHFGIGHNCEANPLEFKVFNTIVFGDAKDKVKTAVMLFRDDIDEAERMLYNYCRKYMTVSNKQVLTCMCFQMGIGSLLGFKKMFIALDNNDYKTAHKEALDSKWGRRFPERAKETVKFF